MTRKTLNVLTLVLLAAATSFGQASRVQNIVGSNGANAERGMGQAGYTMTSTHDDDYYTYDYYWNNSQNRCVTVMLNNNRVESVSDATPSDCGRKKSNNAAVGTAVGVGVGAAIIGALIATHKSHHHDNDKHYNNATQENDYERGYRDGLYNSAWHNYTNSNEYTSGYSAGVEERNKNTQHSSGWGGTRAFQPFSDVEGMSARDGARTLESRGFRIVDQSSAGDTAYNIFYNSQTRQCIQVTMWDEIYHDLNDVENRKCR